MSSFKLTYFPTPGRAEPIRIAFFLADIPFENHHVDFQGFMAEKAAGKYPLGAVPILEVDGQTFTQTTAMLRYVAKLGDSQLYPSDPSQALVVDTVLETLNDTLSHAMTPSFWEKDMDKKLAMRAELATGPLKQAFTYIEGFIESGPFVTGETLTIADLMVASQVLSLRSGILDGLDESHLKPYPRMNALADAYLADPRIVAYTTLT